ncbi:DUF2905 domain-containing protein [Cupriavidus basilensis]|uniref:DUF2905 domain-containing protein n=1 Tax=Cupriavidus basilensis TaxID=68895 RepID=A0ABT6ANQ2_9BURK|nr:DUF2905 domain-containing protein [Cupriavidus basilensis]MDF3834245.1 DUF2905 domain-containing protein [Cupriavidus basilensis]
MSRTLIVLGLILVAGGLLWPWLSRLGLGHLPGDIVIHRQHLHLYFPITSSLLVSAVASLIVWLIGR